MSTIANKIKKLILTTVLIITILFSLFFYLIYQSFTDRTIEKKSYLIETVIKNDYRKFADELFDRRTDSIKIHAAQILKIKGVIFVDIIDIDGLSLLTGMYYDRKYLSANVKKPLYTTTYHDGINLLICFFPVTILDEVIGYVKVEYSLDEISKAGKEIALFSILLILGTSVSLGIALNYYLSKNVTSPIENLMLNIQRIVMDREKLNITINGESEEEIQEMIRNNDLNEVEILEASFRILMIRLKGYSDHMEENIKSLKGMLPICSSCKKIRDDQGYWHMVEVYIHEHSEVEFSHGICPDCAKKLYPEFYKKE